ncbi:MULTISPECIES: hypothetical protein [Photorhabdus]|nr:MULTISPECIES: hypothetical protein [Photorhabdus]NDL55318.1 hypothetical protein [Photorhabdus laumondii subsp. laumondii]
MEAKSASGGFGAGGERPLEKTGGNWLRALGKSVFGGQLRNGMGCY